MSRRKWNKERVLAAIRQRQRKGLSLTNMDEKDRALCAAATRYWGSWRAAMQAAGLCCARRQWSREEVLQRLRRRRQEQLPMTSVWREEPHLYHAARFYFGTWQRALQAVRVPSRLPWTRARVLAELQDLHRRGLLPSAAGKNVALDGRVRRFLGGWRQALEAAGVPWNGRRTWSRWEVLEAIRQRRREGLPLQGVWRDAPRLMRAARKYCGSWHSALLAAGEPCQDSEKWSKEAVIAAIQARCREGRSLRKAWREDRVLVSAACRRFGGWHKAVEAAGYVLHSRRHWSKARVLEELRLWHARQQTRVWRLDASLAKAAKQLFGSVTAAWQAAGITIEPRLWTPERVVAVIQDRYVRGLPLDCAGFQDRRLAYAARKCFASWPAAVAAAGISKTLPHWKPRRAWTKAGILAAIRAWHQRGLPLNKIWKEDRPLYEAAQNRFGNWRSAVRATGLESEYRPGWTKAEVIDEIVRWYEQGVAIDRISAQDGRLQAAVLRLFGGWHEALLAAGLPVQNPEQLPVQLPVQNSVQNPDQNSVQNPVPKKPRKARKTTPCREKP